MVNLLRGLLDDPQDESVPLVVKLSYAAAGVDWLFPDAWATAVETVVLDDTGVDLAGRGDDAALFRVLRKHGTEAGVAWDGFEILPDAVSPVLWVRDATPVDGTYSAVLYWVIPYGVSEAAADVDHPVVPCPPSAGFLAAVYYAMSLATASPLDKRLDYTRYSTASQNGVGINEIVGVSQFWLDRADREKERISKPFPPVLF